MSFDVVLWDAFAVGVHDSEVVLGAGVTLLGGQAVPPDGFRVVLRHARTGAVPDPEVELRVSVALRRGFAPPGGASASSSWTPRPVAYICPRLVCASASPASARARRSASSCAADGVSCAWTGGPSTERLRTATTTVARTA